MPELVPWFLFLHVAGGDHRLRPELLVPDHRGDGRRRPGARQLRHPRRTAISTKRVVPVALTMPVTGIGLIWAAGIDPFSRELALAGAGDRALRAALHLLCDGPDPDHAAHHRDDLRPAAGDGAGLRAERSATGADGAVRKVQRGGLFLSAMIAGDRVPDGGEAEPRLLTFATRATRRRGSRPPSDGRTLDTVSDAAAPPR